MAQTFAMNGGDGICSYVKNSNLQRDGINTSRNIMKEALNKSLDVKTLVSNSTSFTIVDLGCSVGQNTLLAMQTVIQTVEDKYHLQGLDPEKLEIQVFFNDQTTNDFNTLFASLGDQRKYFAAGVPGSFYGRLFPCSSIHLAYSSSALHWLSKLPEELLDKKSPAWNKGKIHYTGASDAVVRAYLNQFDKDTDMFFKARAQEIAPGGMMVILMPGVPDGVLTHEVGLAFTFLGSILVDMVKERLLNEEQVDSLNIPQVYPSVKQMTKLVEKNGSFEIVKMELRSYLPNAEVLKDVESLIMHIRAIMEGILAIHLGSEIIDQVFAKAFQQKTRLSDMLHSCGLEISCAQFFAVLKRK